MKIDELEAQLERDSADQAPPWGARSVQLARELGAEATDLLLGRVDSGEPVAFVALEALRESAPEAYERIPAAQRSGIYAGELRRNLFFNSWGLPGYSFTDTALALIALGEAAVPSLAGLLDDQAPAPLEGSEDATTSSAYGNRICDYAWAFLNEIRNIEYVYSADVAARDEGIRSLRESLGSPREGSA